jgi:2-polyprenyl-3-methyl-5-hydroxy-6-metoxy-1,4-benzoquinol methylase
MTSPCPACHSTSISLSHHSLRHGLTTVRCRRCGLRFIQERMDDRRQAGLYADEDSYRQFAEAERSVPAVPPRRREWASLLSTAIAHGVASGDGRRPRLLDIGCGAGDFLAVAREAGFDAHGVELSAAAALLAKRDHQLDVTVGDFTSEDRVGHFQAITMLGVLEHVREPAALLKHSRDLLSPGGVLLIYTPVWGAYDRLSTALARMTSGRWSRFIDRRINAAHLQIFPQRTLIGLASTHGLVVNEAAKLCEYNLPVRHYLRSVGIESECVQRALASVVDALINNNRFFRNNQRVLVSKPI